MFAEVVASFPAYLAACRKAGDEPLAFEEWMVKNNYTFLQDRGAPRPFEELPVLVTDMKNDAYRSLSGLLERKAYQLKPGVFFAQFQVAVWLRKKLKLSDKAVDRLLRAEHPKQQARREKFMKRVSCLLNAPEAAHKPWYQGPQASKHTASSLIGKIRKMAD